MLNETADPSSGGKGRPCRSVEDCAPRRVTITLEGHGEATASTEERVLVALERAQAFGKLTGLTRRLPVGCRRGGCGVCRARVVAGDYRRAATSRAHVSQAEEEEGIVLACAIYPSGDLTLRLEPKRLEKKGQTAEKSQGGE